VRTLALAALLAASPALADELDDDFGAPPSRSIALGPVRKGGVLLSLDLGWLRSGLRGDLGLSRTLNLVARVETFALDYGFSAQNAVYAGLRWSPLGGDSTARVSVTGEVGSILHENQAEYVLRGEIAAGAVLSFATPYARAAVRALYFDAGDGGSYAPEGEIGLGVERNLGSILVGAEAALWLRPALDTLPQWRIRAAYEF
jgi:hypothetical protein